MGRTVHPLRLGAVRRGVRNRRFDDCLCTSEIQLPPRIETSSRAVIGLIDVACLGKPTFPGSTTAAFGEAALFPSSSIEALSVFVFKMAKHDLTQELCKNLDRHLAFPLLEFLSNKQLYSETDIQKAKIDLLQKTNMVDYAAEIYTALYKTDDIPEEMNTRRKEVVAKLKTLQVCTSLPLGHVIGGIT